MDNSLFLRYMRHARAAYHRHPSEMQGAWQLFVNQRRETIDGLVDEDERAMQTAQLDATLKREFPDFQGS